MPQHYDPIQDRIDQRAAVREDKLAAECNRLAAERDFLVKQVAALQLIREEQRKCLDIRQKELSEAYRVINHLKSATPCDNLDCCAGGPHIHYANAS